MAVEMAQTFGTGGSPSSDVTGTGQTVTLTSSFAPFAVTIAVPSITGKTLGTNGNDYSNVNFWTSAGSDYNARTNSLGLQTIGVDLWGVHIKVGTHTTAATDLYKQPELGPELARCQRYYVSNVQTALFSARALSTPSSNCGLMTYWPVKMRGNPSVASTGSANISSLAVAGITVDGAYWTGAATSGVTTATISGYTADAEL
jgi:hypothetical protein